MQYIVEPIGAFLKWTFDTILVPLGELPALINPNNLFILAFTVGLIYWVFLQGKFNKKARQQGELE